MKKSILTRQKIAEVEQKIIQLNETRSSSWDDAAQKEFDDLNKDRIALTSQALREEQVEEMQDAQAKREADARHQQQRSTEEEKVKKRYSLMRALQCLRDQKPLDGVEGEMYQEGLKEAAARGLEMSGNLIIPSMMTRRIPTTEQRATMVAGTGSLGGNLVPRELGEVIPFLNPRLKTVALGATELEDLVGNIDLPKVTARANAAFAGEIATAAETNPTLGMVTMTPKRVAAWTQVSKTLMRQSSISVEAFVKRQLEEAIRIAIDGAALNGSGSAGVPLGVLNTAGIGSVAGGVNGLIPTWANLVKLKTLVAKSNADFGKLAYLLTPEMQGTLETVEKFANSGKTIWHEEKNQIGAYRAEVSTQMPSNLTKGTANAICHAILYGNWEDLVIGYWGGYDITVDPYTKAKEAAVEVTINTWVDTAVLHAESFAAMKDGLVI